MDRDIKVDYENDTVTITCSVKYFAVEEICRELLHTNLHAPNVVNQGYKKYPDDVHEIILAMGKSSTWLEARRGISRVLTRVKLDCPKEKLCIHHLEQIEQDIKALCGEC